MTALSDIPGVSPPAATASKKHVAFTCFLRVEPLPGKRWERIRDIEQMANDTEALLETIACDDGSYGLSFDFTKPVAFTRQFGNKQARLSFHGHYCALLPPETFTKTPVGERTVVNAGEFKTGPGASRRPTRETDPSMDTLVKELKDLIESTTGLTVTRLEFARVIYGAGGFHFPR
jgi:hypothetical protein